MSIYKVPKYLVIHLKRFKQEDQSQSYNSYSYGYSYRRSYSGDKLDKLVTFPLEDLDLTKYVMNHELPKEYLIDQS